MRQARRLPRRTVGVALAALALAALPVASGALNWQVQDLSQDSEATNFLTSAMAEAEPGAVILSSGDERTFALWYGVYGLGLRPDLALLNVNLLSYEWYRRTLAETHRGLLPSSGEVPPLDSLIRNLAAVRPVYAAEDLGLGFPVDTSHPLGVLTRLKGAGK